jgi:hypothetical protein
MDISSNITSSLLSLYGYSNQSLSSLTSSSTSSELSNSDSSSISSLAQSLLSGTTDDSSESEVSTYYQLGNFGKIVQSYASEALSSLDSDDEGSTEEVDETDSSDEEDTSGYSWNSALSAVGQRSITSGLISLYESSSGEEREALKEQILAGLSTTETSYNSYLSTQSSISSDSWSQLSNLILGSRDDDSSSGITVNFDNLEGVDMTSAQMEELSSLQMQVLAVNSYTQLSSAISSINLRG